MVQYICVECKRQFQPPPNTRGKFCSLKCCGVSNGVLTKERHQLKIRKYFEKPETCVQCNSNLDYTKRKNKFCGSSCAAKYNNARKDFSLIKMGPAPKPKIVPEKKEEWPHTRVYLCTCKISGIKWYSPTVKTLHPSVLSSKEHYSYQCRFRFSISQYPEWFAYASELILAHGWYSAANRGNNLSGCSRDHLYSVRDGFTNKVDPRIISHPANCEVVPHRINQNKNKKSTLTLEQLLQRIYDFEEKYGVSGRN